MKWKKREYIDWYLYPFIIITPHKHQLIYLTVSLSIISYAADWYYRYNQRFRSLPSQSTISLFFLDSSFFSLSGTGLLNLLLMKHWNHVGIQVCLSMSSSYLGNKNRFWVGIQRTFMGFTLKIHFSGDFHLGWLADFWGYQSQARTN